MRSSTYRLDQHTKLWYSALLEPHMLLFYLVFIWGACLRFYVPTEAFPDAAGHYKNGNAGYMCVAARNWVRYGLWNLKFFQVIDGGPLVAGTEVYTHHPPLVPMLIWFCYKITGSFSEWCAGIVPITFSLGTLVLLYLVVRRIWNEQVALLASFCYAVAPYATYFATNVCYETGDQFFFLLIFYWYLRYMESQRFKHFAFMCVSLVLGSLNDWPALYTVPILGLHWFFGFPGKRRLYFLLYPAVAVVMMGVFLLIIAKGEGTWWIPQFAKVINPAAPSAADVEPHTLSQWIDSVVLGFLLYFCTPVVMGLGTLWIGGFLARCARREVTHQDIMLVILLSYGIMHIVLGEDWAYFHDQWSSVIMPGMAVASAVAFYNLFNGLATRYPGRSWIWKGLLYASVLVFGVFCTYRFYSTVQVTDTNTKEFQNAMIMKENTKFEDHILTSQGNLNPMVSRYYADRNIYFDISDLQQFVKVYKTPYRSASWVGGPPLQNINPVSTTVSPVYRYFFLADEDMNRCAALYGFLKAVYPMRAVEGFTIFDLKSPNVSDEGLSELLRTRFEPFDFYERFDKAEVGLEDPLAAKPEVDNLTVEGQERRALHMAPGTTVVFKDIPLDLASPLLKFAIAIPAEEWTGDGDGLIFEVTVTVGDDAYNLFSKYLNPNKNPVDRHWDEQVIDLSAFRGQYIDLVLAVKYGPEPQALIGGWGSLEIIDASLLQSSEEATSP